MSDSDIPLDVLIFGGGAAGLWTLSALREAGYSALLLESKALGAGQTLQSQGIIHGGGKYALRGVADLESARAAGFMPARWREHLAGRRRPDLSQVAVLSEDCLMWQAGSGFMDRVAGLFLPLLSKSGMLNVPPLRVSRERLPEPLRRGASRVYALAEPVLDVFALVQTLGEALAPAVRSFGTARFDPGDQSRKAVEVVHTPGRPPVHLRPKLIVLAAGRGNGELLREAGLGGGSMAELPLRMALLKGPLPELQGHALGLGKTQATITSPRVRTGERIWQLGGELAEKLASVQEGTAARDFASAHIRRWLPGLDLARCSLSFYWAVRAEGKNSSGGRLPGEALVEVAPGILAVWPKKLALVPLLCDRIFSWVRDRLGETRGGKDEADGWRSWLKPQVAAPPWEKARWYPAV